MSNVAKATVGLMIATIIAKVLGFGRELVLASSYGASMYSDAYLTAMNIPTVLFSVIGGTLGTVLIPMYFEVNKDLGEKYSLKFINNVFNLVIVICLVLAILGILFTKPLVKVFAIGFKGDILDVAINFTRVLIMGIVFTGLSYIITAYLQIKNNFAVPGLISVPRNIIIMTSILLSEKYGPYLMVWGTLLGMASEFLIQLPFAIRKGFKYKPCISIKDQYIKKTVLLIGPVLIGVGVNQVNTMVDRTLASTLTEGSISSLNYANKLNSFVIALFIVSIASVIYPMLSKLSSENNKEKFRKSIVQSVNSVVLLVMPISVGAIVLAKPIVSLLFERGAFDSRATSMTAIALIMYSLGMLSTGLRSILDRVFYSLQDTKTPMINSVISMGMNIILNIIFIKYLKIAGLALATSISSTVCIILLFISLNKRMEYFGQDKIIRTMIKSLVAAVGMGAITRLAYNLLNNIIVGTDFIQDVVVLLGSIGIGAIVYAVLVVLLKVEEVNVVLNIVKSKLNRNFEYNDMKKAED